MIRKQNHYKFCARVRRNLDGEKCTAAIGWRHTDHLERKWLNHKAQPTRFFSYHVAQKWDQRLWKNGKKKEHMVLSTTSFTITTPQHTCLRLWFIPTCTCTRSLALLINQTKERNRNIGGINGMDNSQDPSISNNIGLQTKETLLGHGCWVLYHLGRNSMLGGICWRTLKKLWHFWTNLAHILSSISCLFSNFPLPSPSSSPYKTTRFFFFVSVVAFFFLFLHPCFHTGVPNKWTSKEGMRKVA